MKTRAEKYETLEGKRSRTSRNEKLYQDVSNMTLEYEYINTDNAVDLSSARKGRTSREDFQKQKELDKIIPKDKQTKNLEIDEVEPKEDRVYDINEILKMARESTLFEEEKKHLNTEYNILTKLDVNSLENEEMKKEERRNLIDDVYGKEQKKSKKKEKDIKEDKDLLNDLISSDPEDTISNEIKLTKELKEEKEPKEEQIATQLESITITNVDLEHTKEIINGEKQDKKLSKKEKKEQRKLRKKAKDDAFVFTTDKLPVINEADVEFKEPVIDMQDDKEPTEEFVYDGDGKGLMIAIIIISILILLTIGFFVYEYFFA